MTRLAAIDIGTTSIKLLIRDADNDVDLERRTFVTLLGRGIGSTGRLDEAGVERTLEALAECARLSELHGVGRRRAVATSACRDAADRDRFLDRAEAVLGVRPVVLPAEEEGALAFASAVAALPADAERPVLLIAIGGGSTQLVFGDGRPEVTRSVEIGASGLCERELRHDPPRPEELTNAIGLVQDHLDDVLRDHPAIGSAPTIVGVGGTIEVAASIELGLADFTPAAVHGFRFDRAAVEDVFRTMATESLAERVHNPGLPADRAGLIVGGCCVLVAMMRRLQAPALVVSSHGLVDAVASRLLAEPS